MKPITWSVEPLGHRAQAFFLVARNTSTGAEARRFYGHALLDVLGADGLWTILAYDARRLAEEVLP